MKRAMISFLVGGLGIGGFGFLVALAVFRATPNVLILAVVVLNVAPPLLDGFSRIS